MAVGLKPPGDLQQIAGIRLASVHSGIKSDAKVKDLVLIEINDDASVASVFTRNRFCAAPVIIARQHLALNPTPRYLLINSGNANAGTGDAGIEHAVASCRAVADATAVSVSEVLPFSTGVIATELPLGCIEKAVPGLFDKLDRDHWLQAAEGIMTTDTLAKAVSAQLQIHNQTVSITGIAKGSGMIKPNMATMLSFIATDALIETAELESLLGQMVSKSFNSITVDGDTSTNDACVLIATGGSGVPVSCSDNDFVEALQGVFQQLAQSIIRDAEGATKYVEIEVQQAASVSDAREVAYCIAHSPLVKTALFACDPNWGRILAAVGRANIENLDIDGVDLYLGNTCLLKRGLPAPDYREELGQAEMDSEEIRILVKLNQGSDSATIWTSDLSYEYVKINAEYRS